MPKVWCVLPMPVCFSKAEVQQQTAVKPEAYCCATAVQQGAGIVPMSCARINLTVCVQCLLVPVAPGLCRVRSDVCIVAALAPAVLCWLSLTRGCFPSPWCALGVIS